MSSIRVTTKNDRVYVRTSVSGVSTSVMNAALALKADITQSITNGDTTHSPSGDAVFDALALKANLTDIETISEVSITQATILDNTAFGKVHICTGTSSNYNLTLPTPSASNAGKSLVVKGDPALTVVVTVVGTIDSEANRAIGAYGVFVLKVNAAGTAYQLINEIGSWIPWTITWGGFSSNPVVTSRYFRVGKKISFWIRNNGSLGTSNATTTTFTLPFNASTSELQLGLIISLWNASASRSATPGMFITRKTGSAVVDCYRDSAALAWSSSGSKGIELSGEVEIA